MAIKANTNSVLVFDEVGISKIIGRFSYIQYNRDEYREPAHNEDGKRYRFIKLDWQLDNPALQVENVPIPTEIVRDVDLQAGFFSMTPIYERQWQIDTYTIDKEIKASSYADMELNSLRADPIEVSDNSESEPIYDITSGQPIIRLSEEVPQAPRALLSEPYATHFQLNLQYNPITEYEKIKSLQPTLQQLRSRTNGSKNQRVNKTSNDLTYPYLSDILNSYQAESLSDNTDGKVIGYIVLKFNAKGFLEKSVYLNKPSYTDYDVLYGTEYIYQVYPVLQLSNIPVFVSNEAKITVQTKERLPPLPPDNFNIQWKSGTKYLATWMPKWRINKLDPDGDGTKNDIYESRDVKGYQIFIRESLREPYRLMHHIVFSDLLDINQRRANDLQVPDDFVTSYESDAEDFVPKHPTSFEIDLAPNKDHYLAMCALDARGRPSGYSTQIRIFRNSVTGEVEKENVSYTGAPRNQPNLLLKDPIVEDSFKVSNLSKCRVFYNPDLQENEPDTGMSIDIQMFDTKSDIYQSHKLNISAQQSQ
jgi:hypothetical protein